MRDCLIGEWPLVAKAPDETERNALQSQVRELAAKTLSTRVAIKVLRDAWNKSADRSALFATESPTTPEQWRAYGDAECLRACADELDPEKDFEPCEIERLQRDLASANQALAERWNETAFKNMQVRAEAAEKERDWFKGLVESHDLLKDNAALQARVVIAEENEKVTADFLKECTKRRDEALAQAEKLAEALEPFATMPNNGAHTNAREDTSAVFGRDGHELTVGHFRRARATLSDFNRAKGDEP